MTLLMSGASSVWHWLQQFADSYTDTAGVMFIDDMKAISTLDILLCTLQGSN